MKEGRITGRNGRFGPTIAATDSLCRTPGAFFTGIRFDNPVLANPCEGFTIGMLVAFQMFASRLSQPVMRIVGLWQQFQQANTAVKRLGDIMDAPTEPYALIPVRTQTGTGRIELQGLAFRYGEDRPFLYRDLTATIPAGSAVAILGPSGSGKSTLTKLLQGFYQPGEGSIKLDGRDIRHLSANELRRHFGVVPQESVLFSGTLYDNLILANPYATFEQVVSACKMAEIHEVIESLPQGTRPGSASTARGFPAGRSSAWPLPAPCSSGRRC